MKKTVITVLLTMAGSAVVFLIFIYSGIYNVSQLAPHNSLVRWMINKTKDRSIDSRIDDIKLPALSDNTMIVAVLSTIMKCV